MNFLSRRIDIHFIDSPESAAKKDGFIESCKIRQQLRLPAERLFHYECITAEQLKSTLAHIAVCKNDYKYPRKALPFIHIAAHGVEDGLTLGDNVPLGWNTLVNYLKPVGETTDYNALLAFSSCHGFFGYRLAYLESGKPYHLVIGPTKKIAWKFLIQGYSSFYNDLLVDGVNLAQAIRRLNNVIKSSPSKIDYTFGWEVQARYEKIGYDETAKVAVRKKQAERT